MNLHHAIHINNYLHHKVAALSSKVLALCCNASADTPSQLVAISLQGNATFSSSNFNIQSLYYCLSLRYRDLPYYVQDGAQGTKSGL